MQIGGVEIANAGQRVPVQYAQGAVFEFDGLGLAQFHQRAADGGQRRGKRFCELGLGERQPADSGFDDADFFSAVILFAEKMGEAHLQFAAAVVGDGFAEDGGVDQGFLPEREADFGAFLEQVGDGGVRHQRYSRSLHGAERVVHRLKKKRLSVRHVAGDVEGEILPPPGRRVVIAGERAFKYDHGIFWLVALAQDVLIPVDMAQDAGQPANGRDVKFGEKRMLLELSYQYVVP